MSNYALWKTPPGFSLLTGVCSAAAAGRLAGGRSALILTLILLTLLLLSVPLLLPLLESLRGASGVGTAAIAGAQTGGVPDIAAADEPPDCANGDAGVGVGVARPTVAAAAPALLATSTSAALDSVVATAASAASV
mmetsp:Transcript_5537/g.12651  ORF Transcript_5537/g.12651 Transcript_5537/m.12651 type:complete len:136 (+) Transcript_5537:128-535(+)